MSLATRCFACGTVFRVVQDQLKVSEGWVRCGRCNEVFNALETLFDLDRDAPPEWSPGEHLPPAGTVASDEDMAQGVAPIADPAQADRIDEQLFGTRRRDSGSTPATRVDERDRLDFPDAQFEPEEPAPIVWGVPASDAPADIELDVTPPPAPEFMREAQRRERWQSPLARIALGSAALLLSLVLIAQAGLQFRDTVAAQWPATRPMLVAWCEWRSCKIEPPKRIDDIVVENSALTRSSDAEPFKLSITLRNHGALALGVPAVDLSLTDAGGQLVARRVLTPTDLRVGSATIAPGAELPMQLLLNASGGRVAGYTVEVFYP